MIINKRDRHQLIITALGVAHGIADAAAGLLIIRLAMSPSVGAGLTILTYQFLAFGTQPIVGLIIDRHRRARMGVIISLFATAVGLLVRSISPSLTILLAGFGSAAFHVSAGSIVAVTAKKSIVPFGWFTAPGVIGLALGGTLALNTPTDNYLLVALVAISLVLNLILPPQSSLEPQPNRSELSSELAIPLAGKEGIGLLLLGAIAVRSLVWNLVDAVHQSDRQTLLYLALAAGAGKIAGGILADRIGWRQWGTLALLGAAICLNYGTQRQELLLLGVALLQSVTPIALAITISLCPGLPATGSGLALGLAIAIGGIFFLLFPQPNVPTIYLSAIALLALVLLYYSLDRHSVTDRD
jgi:MFS transporter, FSR family, fosmidomycin resistance protein